MIGQLKIFLWSCDKHLHMYFILIYFLIKPMYGFLKYIGFIKNVIKKIFSE